MVTPAMPPRLSLVFGHYNMDIVKTLLIPDLLGPLACGVLYSELT